jgi:hypothetical protein
MNLQVSARSQTGNQLSSSIEIVTGVKNRFNTSLPVFFAHKASTRLDAPARGATQ